MISLTEVLGGKIYVYISVCIYIYIPLERKTFKVHLHRGDCHENCRQELELTQIFFYFIMESYLHTIFYPEKKHR